MVSVELGSHIDMAFTTIEDSEKHLRDTMKMVYQDLDGKLREAPTDLPQEITKKGRWRIITFPGNPRDPAIALKPDGGFTYIKFGFGRNPNQYDLPIAGPRYLEVVVQTLRLLQK